VIWGMTPGNESLAAGRRVSSISATAPMALASNLGVDTARVSTLHSHSPSLVARLCHINAVTA
jgi:hypothetical protein